METEVKTETNTYNCICRKCGKDFVSVNELDTDGDGKCESCHKQGLEIAQKVDSLIAERRKNRPPALPRQELQEVNGYINARQLM